MFLTKIDNSDTHGNLIISHTRIIMECVLKPIVSNMVERSQLTLYWGVVFLFLEMEGGGSASGQFVRLNLFYINLMQLTQNMKSMIFTYKNIQNPFSCNLVHR